MEQCCRGECKSYPDGRAYRRVNHFLCRKCSFALASGPQRRGRNDVMRPGGGVAARLPSIMHPSPIVLSSSVAVSLIAPDLNSSKNNHLSRGMQCLRGRHHACRKCSSSKLTDNNVPRCNLTRRCCFRQVDLLLTFISLFVFKKREIFMENPCE